MERVNCYLDDMHQLAVVTCTINTRTSTLIRNVLPGPMVRMLCCRRALRIVIYENRQTKEAAR